MDQFKMHLMSGVMNGNGDTSTGLPALNMSAKEPGSLEAILSQAQSAGDRSNQHHPVAEFLYQLTKMLTDDNSEIVEWVEGRIKVHYPERLEGEVLHKYFRHSKFASFQRQLNYFGFRKIAGKGKMSPCSYVNESATSDIRSLLLIKRKTNGSAARKAMAQRAAVQMQQGLNPGLGTGMPGLAGAPGLGFGGFGSFSALNQLQMQKQLGIGLLAGPDNPLSQFLAQGQQQQSWGDLQQLGGLKPNMPSIEQLQAQIASLSKQQGMAAAAAQHHANANGGSSNAENPATAALNAFSMPATSASQAANAAAGQSNNLFESATNLKALIGNDQGGNDNAQAKNAATGSFLSRLPSSTSGMFQGLASNASLGNLLASSNRLNSLLSLNSFLSREPSLADFGMMAPNAAHLAAFQQSQMALNQQQQSYSLASMQAASAQAAAPSSSS
jgi:HSF-type DNA-binding